MCRFFKSVISLVLAIILVSGMLPLGGLGVVALAADTDTTKALYTQLTESAEKWREVIEADDFYIKITESTPTSTPISTPEDLDAIRDNLAGHYYLTNDIDLSDYGTWVPIGHDPTQEFIGYYTAFTGTLDGRGYTINGLTIKHNPEDDLDYVGNGFDNLSLGLFQCVDGNGKVINLSLKNIDISISTGDSINVGAITGVLGSSSGSANAGAKVMNCKISGTINVQSVSILNNYAYVGGLVGNMQAGMISDCYNGASLDCETGEMYNNYLYSGGIVGYVRGSSSYIANITNCANNGAINNSDSNSREINGGIIGYASYANIGECYNFATVNGCVAGGIVGDISSGSLQYCYNEGTINGSDNPNLGGGAGIAAKIGGHGNIDFKNSINVGNVFGMGGIIGATSSTSSVITNCSNYGTVTGVGNRVGGVIGYLHNSSIYDCHNFGNVIGYYVANNSAAIGGVVGEVLAQMHSGSGSSTYSIVRCHNEGSIEWDGFNAVTSSVNSNSSMGGIVGVIRNSVNSNSQSIAVIINQCYNTADLISNGNVGGILGSEATEFGVGGGGDTARVSTFVRNSYNTGNIYGSRNQGGIAGGNGRFLLTVENCYNAGNVQYYSAYSSTNGIAGNENWTGNEYQLLTITSCVALSSYINGIDDGYAYYIGGDRLGSNQGINAIRQNNLALNSISGNAANDADSLISQTQATTQTTYTAIGWDFDDAWKMPVNSGYPILQWQSEGGGDSNGTGSEGAGENESTTETVTINHSWGSTDIKWGRPLFYTKSTEYSDDIALVAAALSAAAYNGDENNGYYIEKAYRDLGFNEENIYLYSYPNHPKNCSALEGMNDEDSAFSIAHRVLDDIPILVIALRGTEGIGDAIKDISVGSTNFLSEKAHNGFYDFYEDVVRGLVDYADSHPEISIASDNGSLRILITGHSYGAAGANLLGAWFNNPLNNWTDKEKIYVYTFASPNTYYGNNPEVSSCINIFNIVNVEDPVPKLPFRSGIWPDVGDPWRKFGYTKQFDIVGDSVPGHIFEQADTHHPMPKYITAIQSGAIGKISHQNSVALVFACPVDIEVYDRNNVLICSIVDNVVDGSVTRLTAYVDGDTKIVLLSDTEKYSLRLYGTDEGSMTFSVQELDGQNGGIVSQKIFNNVTLADEKTMTSEVGGEIATFDVRLLVLDSSDNPIKEIKTDGSEVEINISDNNSENGNGSNNMNGSGNNSQNDSENINDSSDALDSSATTGEFVNPFIDVSKNDWFYDNVAYVYRHNLFKGTTATTFSPNSPMTRGMLVTVLYRFVGEPDIAEIENPFNDVSDGTCYHDAIIWAADNGIVFGVGDGKFAPDNHITRQDLSVVLARYAEKMDISLPELVDVINFIDEKSIAAYAKEAVLAMQLAKIVVGKPGNVFDPKGIATRAEVATMLHNFSKLAE